MERICPELEKPGQRFWVKYKITPTPATVGERYTTYDRNVVLTEGTIGFNREDEEHGTFDRRGYSWRRGEGVKKSTAAMKSIHKILEKIVADFGEKGIETKVKVKKQEGSPHSAAFTFKIIQLFPDEKSFEAKKKKIGDVIPEALKKL